VQQGALLTGVLAGEFFMGEGNGDAETQSFHLQSIYVTEEFYLYQIAFGLTTKIIYGQIKILDIVTAMNAHHKKAIRFLKNTLNIHTKDELGHAEARQLQRQRQLGSFANLSLGHRHHNRISSEMECIKRMSELGTRENVFPSVPPSLMIIVGMERLLSDMGSVNVGAF